MGTIKKFENINIHIKDTSVIVKSDDGIIIQDHFIVDVEDDVSVAIDIANTVKEYIEDPMKFFLDRLEIVPELLQAIEVDCFVDDYKLKGTVLIDDEDNWGSLEVVNSDDDVAFEINIFGGSIDGSLQYNIFKLITKEDGKWIMDNMIEIDTHSIEFKLVKKDNGEKIIDGIIDKIIKGDEFWEDRLSIGLFENDTKKYVVEYVKEKKLNLKNTKDWYLVYDFAYDSLEVEYEHQLRKIVERSVSVEIYTKLGLDRFNNHVEIIDYIINDLREAADLENWHNGDVVIAFRRFVENIDS